MASSMQVVNPEAHYESSAHLGAFPDAVECKSDIRNIGWTLGNECPHRCNHCYSMSARRKGRDLEIWMVDRIVSQLACVGVETVNLGGNEPIYTNGPNPNKSLLPYIMNRLKNANILVGLTTSGNTLLHLNKHKPESLHFLNDVDISLDSPFPQEHDSNRGTPLYGAALKCLQICKERDIDHTIIMCAMNWNFTDRHIDKLLELAKNYNANIRINTLKPVRPDQERLTLSPEQFYRGFSRLIAATEQIDLGDPLLAASTLYLGKGCPCGRTSFRIHSITPEGCVPVSPCVYAHDFKVGDLLVDDLSEIIESEQFKEFRRRNGSPWAVEGCRGCEFLENCRGGCASRGYFNELYTTGRASLASRDPLCLREFKRSGNGTDYPFPTVTHIVEDRPLVHRDYLCTWIGKPK